MSGFTDSKGRDWSFRINVGVMAAVKDATGINLSEAIKPKSTVIEDITEDPSLFFGVLTSILKKQLREADVDLESFAEGLDDEDVTIGAMKSLIEAIIDFFPKDRSGPLKRAFNRLWSATEAKANTQAKVAIERIEGIDFDQMSSEIVEKATGSPTKSSENSTSSTSGSSSSSSPVS